MRNRILYILFATVLLASCASQKNATDTTTPTGQTTANDGTSFVAGVINGGVQTQNIVGSASVTLKFGDKDITVPGSVHMRRDQVIRIQLFIPLLGTEVGRLEFTPNYVLVVDRMNKQYIKGDYNQLDFLRDNGISFYSLQALFWNQLIAPGKQKVGVTDASLFSADMSGANAYLPITLSQGQMKYQWSASRKDKSLTSAVITYNSASAGTSMLSWLYSDFAVLGKQKFPKTQEFSFQTTAGGKKQKGDIKIKMSELKTSSDWDTETTVSSKYKLVDAEDVFSKLMSF